MQRERLLTRQGGERHLGLKSLGEDTIGSYLRLQISPVERHREHAALFLLESDARRDPHDQKPNYDTRECVAKTLQILEEDCWIHVQGDDGNSVATGMPSLASINPASVAGESCSVHSSSRSGVSKFSSMVSLSSHSYTNETEDNDSITSTSMVPEPSVRQKMRVLLLEGINEDALAETLDCLEPVLVVSPRDSSRQKQTRWGSPPCDTEITVCRPQPHFKGSDSPIFCPRTTRHELASRNADEAPSLPPRENRVFSMDHSPIVPRRHSALQAYQARATQSGGLERWKSLDQVPSQPRRQGSSSRYYD